jgi:1-aminocyclopropane-1-carboxylate deaminase/D-cysteine desulfhydrase-like pyridoxal-dependent ACC family enzyme
MRAGALTLPTVPLAPGPTPVEELAALRRVLGGGPRLLVKRDDAIPFAFGGNKVRKMRFVAADALAAGADTLITSGGVQSNHARVTAAAAARLGMRCILVVNGPPPSQPRGNALLDRLLGAEVRHVAGRAERAPAVQAAADEVRAAGGRPYVIPIGASVPLGAAAFVEAIAELCAQADPPDVIVHATSSGGTQAGLVAGCVLSGLRTRVIGISADESAATLTGDVTALLGDLPALFGTTPDRFASAEIIVDDRFVGEGYGIPSDASHEAATLLARTEALFLDHTYTAKAMAGLIARCRSGEFHDDQTVLFWHTGGQVGLFA